MVAAALNQHVFKSFSIVPVICWWMCVCKTE